MGSQAIQGELWGKRPKDWAAIQEKTGEAGYRYVLDQLKPGMGDQLLDVGCGSGYFAKLANDLGVKVTGIDASAPLLDEAKARVPSASFLTGEMEALPFADDTFDVVCGFNSFQYAADTQHALKEAARVLKPNGKLTTMIWGNKEDCEAASYLKAVGSLLPPPPPGAPGPFALSENSLLEQQIKAAGLNILSVEDIDSVWDYPDIDTALKGLISAGPVARAIDHSGFDKVQQAIQAAVQPYLQNNGHVVYRNKFRIVIAGK